MQTAIVDTNVLLHSPDALDSFKGYGSVVIPLSVIEELDDQKKRQDDAGRNARKAIKIIDKLQTSSMKLKGGIPLRIESIATIPAGADLDLSKPDNRLLALASELQKRGEDIVVITNDAACRVKARHLGLPANNFEHDRVHIEIDNLYTGIAKITVPSSMIDSLYSSKRIEYTGELYENQFVILTDECNPKHTGIGRYTDGSIVTLKYADARPWDIAPRNLEQTFFIEALMEPSIQLVTAIGRAGTGKTVVAAAASGYQVEKELYKRVIYYKSIVPIGRDLGYLPGSEQEKLKPWMASIYDTYEFILGSEDRLEHLIDKKMVELSTLTYIRGRSLPSLYIVTDEVENMTPHETKTLISRAGDGTKIVLIGDPYQIDHPYLDFQNNGLVYTMDRFKGQKIYAHIMLKKPERSVLSGLAAELL